MKRDPKVSVCIPTYNRASLLRETIQSVLSQTFEEFELIVSDNASNDSTEDVVNSFKDNRIQYIKNERNIGLVGNFNQCLALAKGEYVTVFHDDDLMLPDNLVVKVRALDLNPGVGFVHSKVHIIDECGAILHYNTSLDNLQTGDSIESGRDFLRRSLLSDNLVYPTSVLIRKECYLKLGGFSDKVHFTTDFEYWMRISTNYDVMFLAKPLIKYRMFHQTEWTTSPYIAVVEGGAILNLKGIEEVYKAKRLVLNYSKYILKDWEMIRKVARRKTSDLMKNLIEKKHLDQGDRRKAIESILHMFKAFPGLLYEKPTAKLLIKIFLGHQTTRVLKSLTASHKNSDNL